MPVQIDAKRDSDFDDPIGMLGDCHRRIERFLAALIAVSKQCAGGALDARQREALETALLYFRNSAPKHTADEEESLFPRMRDSRREDTHSVLERIARLESDHERAAALHREIDHLGSRWLAANTLSEAERGTFKERLDELSAIYSQHIRLEENEVFPVARRVLDKTALEQVGGEMAARRGVSKSGTRTDVP